MNAPRSEKRGESALEAPGRARWQAAQGRTRWGSLAGSILAGVVVGTLLWSGGSRNSLGREVLEHVQAELRGRPDAAPPAAAEVAGVLAPDGIRLRAGAGTVAHARRCRFRGRTVPHLVVGRGPGAVTVLLLRHEPVESAVEFSGRGISGRIVPAGPGSLVVAGLDGTDLDEATARLLAAVEWL